MMDHHHAPKLLVPPIDLVAVEHPMIVKNVENALKTFGRGHPFKQMMDPDLVEDALPLYLRPNDPLCGVLESHVTRTSNVLLKVTVPKRTGRRRKRRSEGPFVEADISDSPIRLDARTVFTSLRDNTDNYQIQPLGVVNVTHRYRGLADFHQSNVNSSFINRVKNQVLSNHLDDFKSFRFDPSRGYKLNEDVIPPPFFAESNLPYPWAYQTGYEMNEAQQTGPTQSRIKGVFSYDLNLPIPNKPKRQPSEKMKPLVDRLRKCFELRPIWTKRALENHLGDHKLYGDVKSALHFVSYQFHGGPWRDASIQFGIDPRRDPKYRFYQTFVFKIMRIENPEALRFDWVMSDFGDDALQSVQARKWQSHIFDGEAFCMDGRTWQICDITDPLLKQLFTTNTLREVPDLKHDGWYCNGTCTKLRAIMRTKIRALQTGQKLSDQDFQEALKVPDHVILTDEVKGISIPLPNVAIIRQLGDQEWIKTKKQRNGRDEATFRMNTDHGSKRGKKMDAQDIRDALAGGNTETETPIRQSIETGDVFTFNSSYSPVHEEGNIMDEEEDVDDVDCDASLDELHDDSSLDSGSADEEFDE